MDSSKFVLKGNGRCVDTIYEEPAVYSYPLKHLEPPHGLCASESELSEDFDKIETKEDRRDKDIMNGDELEDEKEADNENHSNTLSATSNISQAKTSPNFLPLKMTNNTPTGTNSNSLVIDPTRRRPHKVILVGNSGVGKSSLMLRFCDNIWTQNIQQSVGVDFRSRVMEVEGVEETIQVWDTAGQERFRSVTQSYFRRVDGIVLVYDITNENSFLQLQDWVVCIRSAGQMAAPMAVIGNKIDLENSRAVEIDVAVEFADFYRADFAEVSAKDGRNVEELGFNLLKKMVQRRSTWDSREDSGADAISNESPPTNVNMDNKCCVII